MRQKNTSHVGSEFAEDFLKNIGSGKIIVESEPGLTAEIVSSTLSDVDIIVRAARSKTDAILAEKLNETQRALAEHWHRATEACTRMTLPVARRAHGSERCYSP